MYSNRKVKKQGGAGIRTVDTGLEFLAAHFAGETADARLLVDFYGNRFLVVAEETGEYFRQRFVLCIAVVRIPGGSRGLSWTGRIYLLLALGLLGGLLAFTLRKG